MINTDDYDCTEYFQLKECYDLAAQFEKSNAAKNVLREKLKRLPFPKNNIPLQITVSYPETEMQILSEAVYELANESVNTAGRTAFKYTDKINALPNSAEKEYVLALLSLRSGTDVTHQLDAHKHISAALRYSPNDPRYIALSNILQGVLNDI